MKKILLTLTGFILTFLSFAQSPNLMNYQGVARNAVGNVLPNQPVALRLSILSGSPTGTVVYSETRNATTNLFGLFNVVVGSPGAITTTGTIAGINWTAFGVGSGSKFLQVEIDPVGGTNFFNVGSTQLVSVPYALNAGAAAPVGPAGGDLTGTYPNPTVAKLQGRAVSAAAPANKNLLMWDAISTSWIPATAAQAGVVSGTGTLNMVAKWTPDGVTIGNSQIFDNGTNVGVGTITPANKFTVAAGNNDGIGITSTGTNFANAALMFSNSTTAPAQSNSAVISLKSGGTDRALQFFNSTTGLAAGDIIYNFLNTTTAPVVSILESGNVGIGLTAPTGKLHVTNAGTNDAIISVNTGTGRGGFFQVNNAASTANALEVTTNGTGPSWGIRANSTGTNGAGLFVQQNPTNTSNNVLSNQTGLGRAGLFQNTNTANDADAITGTTVSIGTTASGVHGIAGSSGVTIGAKKGGWGESDNGVGVFGTSSTGIGAYGVSGFGTGIGVAALTFGTGAAFSGTSLSGRVADFSLSAGNASTVVNATTAGTGVAGDFSNTNVANVSNGLRVTNDNATAGQTSSTTGGGAAIFARKGAGLPFYLTNPAGVYGTSSAGIGLAALSSTGIANFGGTTSTGIGVLGQTFFTGGIGVWALGNSSATSYGLVTAGKVQIQGQGAGVNRVLTSDNVGNATWEAISTSGGVSGSGTLNFIPKWTPDGATIGNSQLFDNGTSIGLGTVTPAGKLNIINPNATSGLASGTTIFAQKGTFLNQYTNATSILATTSSTNSIGVGAITNDGYSIVGGTVGTGTAVIGQVFGATGGIGLYGVGNDPTTSYALATSGRVIIQGQGAGAGKVLTSDAVGNATWQAPPAKVSIKLKNLSSDITIPFAYTPITQWQTIVFEEGGSNYNSGTGEYTVPVAGVYEISSNLGFYSVGSNGYSSLLVYVNGLQRMDNRETAASGTFPGNKLSTTVKLNAGDKISVWAYANGATFTCIGTFPDFCNLSITLLH